MQVEDEELEAIAIESKHTIDIDSFVPRAQIDERYLDNPYYLGPEDKVAQDTFAVIRDAMAGKDMVALGRIVVAKRERVVMLQACDKGIMATTLRYAYEVRDTKSFFDEIPDVAVPADMLQLAEHILESKAANFEPTGFKDRYEEAVLAMLKAKQAGRMPATEKPQPRGPNVVSLIDALKRSLAGVPKPKEALKPKATKAKKGKRIEGQREMLLPIAGKGPAKAAKTATKSSGQGFIERPASGHKRRVI